MQKRIIGLVMLTAILMLNLSTLKANEPEKMGKHTLKLLKTIKNWDKETYQKHMVSIEEIYQSFPKQNSDDPIKEVSDKMQQRWTKELDKKFARIREDGEENGIKWRKIKYNDFTYKIESPDNAKIYEGKLYFTYNKTTYSIEVGFLITDNGLRLGNLEDLREETDKKL